MTHQTFEHCAEPLKRRPYLITFTALLVSGGAALAENPYVGGSDINDIAGQQAVDSATTASISDGQKESALKMMLGSNVTVRDSDRGVWGR